MDKMLTLAETVEYLKIGPDKLYLMARKSEIPCFKLNGSWRFYKHELDKWIEALRTPQQPNCPDCGGERVTSVHYIGGKGLRTFIDCHACEKSEEVE